MRSPLSALLLLFLPACTQAQDTLSTLMYDHWRFGSLLFDSSKDSADYARFRQGMTQARSAVAPDTSTVHYRLVWRENQRAGLWMVTRGDGILLKAVPIASLFASDSMSIAFRTVDGRRGLLLMFEEPCGLICRSSLYYVEE